MNELATQIFQLTLLTNKTSIEPDGMNAGTLPVTAAMINVWNNRINTKKARIKEIAAGWV